MSPRTPRQNCVASSGRLPGKMSAPPVLPLHPPPVAAQEVPLPYTSLLMSAPELNLGLEPSREATQIKKRLQLKDCT